MESVTWFLTVAIVAIWLGVGIEGLRRPLPAPRQWNRSLRRIFWTGLWVLALPAGVWGPALWSSVQVEHGDTPSEGTLVARTTSAIRTPFAVRTTTVERDAESALLRRETGLVLQLPLALLAFLGVSLVLRAREGRPGPSGAGRPGPGGPGSSPMCLLLLLPVWLPAGCGGEGIVPLEERPVRTSPRAVTDTLLRIELSIEDTLLYSADQLAASPAGFWVLDRSGFRVAHFDWEGALRWYAGGRGAGPGEFLDPRRLKVDMANRVWVLDTGTNRLTGLGPNGERVDERSLQPLDAVLHDFAVEGTGERFFGMVLGEGLTPVSIDAGGRVERGATIRVDGRDGPTGIALQGLVAGAPESSRWLHAFSTGDGLFLVDGVTPTGGRRLYPEASPFPGMVVARREENGRTTTTRTLTEPRFTAGGVAVSGDHLFIRFVGETADAGRLVDVWDWDTGDYRESLLLPFGGPIAVAGDRLVVSRHDPTPEILVLRIP